MVRKVLIADDHILVRLGIEIIVREILGINCQISLVSDCKELLTKLESDIYDILISDVNMPYNEAIEIMPAVMARQPSLKVLIVSVNPEQIFAHRFLKAGAFGYIQKGNSDEELRKAIFEISNGRRYITFNQVQQFTNAFLGDGHSNPFDALSGREFEVAVLILKGMGILEIGSALSINNSTASTYRGRIFEKLAVKNVIELSNLARAYKVII